MLGCTGFSTSYQVSGSRSRAVGLFEPLDAKVLGYKDVIDVPAGGRARIALRFEEPGVWMFHTHVLEHAERGMMGKLNAQPVSTSSP